jgi:hypothetical protein
VLTVPDTAIIANFVPLQSVLAKPDESKVQNRGDNFRKMIYFRGYFSDLPQGDRNETIYDKQPDGGV